MTKKNKPIKKELSAVQNYALQSAQAKVRAAEKEAQVILEAVASELGIDPSNKSERWMLDSQCRFFQLAPPPPKVEEKEK